jgi:hypothetical protein
MQIVKKGIWLDPVGVSHSLDHTWTTMFSLVVFSFFVPISTTSILLIPVLEGIAHYIIDFVKVRYGCKDNTNPAFWAQFGLDQLAHQLTYLLIVLYLLKDQIY